VQLVARGVGLGHAVALGGDQMAQVVQQGRADALAVLTGLLGQMGALQRVLQLG
jgi:hypothetical protein